MRHARFWFSRFTVGALLLLCASLLTVAPLAAQDAETAPDPSLYDPSVCENDNDGGELSPECAAMIEQFPRPPGLTDAPQDRFSLGYYSFWKVGPDSIAKYDSPGGNVIGEIGAGYNFVTAIDRSVDGWMQIQGGAWITTETAVYTTPSFFTGAVIEEGGLDNQFAWVLDMSRIHVSEYPGGPRSVATDRWLQRYERVNIYATATDEDGWRWYMIGPNHWVEQRFVSKVTRIERPEGVSGRWVAIDLYEQNLVVYDEDTPVFATLISTGTARNPTNEGLFNVWARLPADGMSGSTGAPEAYALQTVPWVMYFDGSIALHGSYWHDIFGYRTSRGCVNMTISDAKWVYEFLAGTEQLDEEGNPYNQVYVYSTGTFGQTSSGI